jgi:molybdate transport system substrate-binding protein
MTRFALSILAALLAIATPLKAGAAEATVAVAANFLGTLKSLEKNFEAATGHRLTLISGSTGKLASQIGEGAPFDALLSADDKATKKLIEDGHALAESEFTYAIGTLALFSADPERIKGDGEGILKAGQFKRLAIANPKLAPYGVAAEAVLDGLGVADALRDRIVMGENIAQTFQMIDTGNAELGFVALSQVLGSDSGRRGSHWVVPGQLHEPIRQNAVLLTRAKDNVAARTFLAFLRSPQARETIDAAGYMTLQPPSQ